MVSQAEACGTSGVQPEYQVTMRIYIASSWKNQHAVELLTAKLREQGHFVISWIENNYEEDHGPDKPFDFEQWVRTPSADHSFEFDTLGAAHCDLFIYMSPGGKDAAAECGIAYSSPSKPAMWALWAKGEDFGLMRKMFQRWFTRVDELLEAASQPVPDRLLAP
jgi:hypothetical protein